MRIETNNTPGGTSLAAGSVSQGVKRLSLNSSEDRNSELGRKTSSTLRSEPTSSLEQEGTMVLCVYVLNQHGVPLMPCLPSKARKLLKKGEARVVRRKPFTIQLLRETSFHTQEIVLGVDPGYEHVGLSAITNNKELYSANVKLRTDVVKLISEKRMYRRNRRDRNTGYRKPRFLNRRIPEGWIAPSVQHKMDSHVRIIKKICSFLPISKIMFEENNFDIQKIKNPEISGIEYQQGEQLDFENVRQYILYRDGHKCVHCGSKNKLNVHHIVPRMTGGNRPDNLGTLCSKCHVKLHNGKIEIKLKKTPGFKEASAMNIVRKRIIEELKKECPVESTWGYATKHARKQLDLVKSHTNDAFVIAGGTTQKRTEPFKIKQRRRNNRCLQLNRKGFKPSIRKQRYLFQPACLVKHLNKALIVIGTHCRGTRVMLDGAKKISANVKNVVLIKFNEGLNYV
ncbi:MAG: RNA-guided endonuclease IscB [Nitrosarchaeum sp.]|nr:RNA-guided endonuclease IscB [Nitrosarchaeum sp.]